jgi:phosphohistidine swiveling domain-containing protein
MISKRQVLAALTTATRTRHDQGREALAGPIVLHLLWRPPASRVDGPPVGGAPLEEAVDQPVGTWLRAMATDQPTAPSRQRPRRHDQGGSEMTDQTQTSLHEVDPDMLPPVITLAEAARLDPAAAPALLGSKAANLARLLGAGFPVPAGVVVTPAAAADWDQASAQLRSAAVELGGRDQRFAVRSSATAEDLAGASYAGQYETVLDVGLEELPQAVRRVFDSAGSARVAAYRQAHPEAGATAAPAGDPSESGMAVLVQVMVAAEAAGVAFSADPLTGARDEVVISAVPGLGERLVSGQATGDQWVVRNGQARRTRATEQAITADQAGQVAALARRVEAHFGSPQDLEWAIATDPGGTEGGLWLLQARPMTALPDPVDWTPPTPGYWMRNLRLGEWLPEAMTPLFADWLLGRIDHGEQQATRADVGAALVFPHAAVNGWYYLGTPALSPRTIVTVLLQGRGRLLRFFRYGVLGPGRDPVVADRRLLAGLAEEWHTELLPRYRRLVQEGDQQVETASPEQLVDIVDRIGAAAGEQLWSLAVVGGSAWKMEGALARFYRQHLAATVDASVQELLVGLPGTQPDLAAHAVQSIDWYHPTAGELGWPPPQPSKDRQRELAACREALTAQCLAVLGDRLRLQARLRALLEVAQRYAVLREQQARQFTLAWPLLRRSALRLGEHLHTRGMIDQAEDVFFLTRAELDTRAPLQDVVARRRGTWERQRRLLAPLTIGRPPRLIQRELLAAVEAARTPAAVAEGAIVGQPASPGRATGAVRIVHGPGDFDRFQPGEVLVARATAPAWTPLFARAAAVVTDGGTLAAHASLVAREYGIPAVVATGDATARLTDGQVVTVDGGAGTIHPPR